MKHTLLLFATTLLLGIHSYAQTGVAINTTGAEPHNSAILDVSATDKGFLIPRMTQSGRNAIDSPAIGLMIYQTDETAGFYYYNGTAWVAVGPDESDPVFNEWNKSTGISITESQISDLGNYIETEADPTVPAHVKSITSTDLTDWNTAHTHSTTTTGSVHGATTVGDNLLRLTNPSAVSFLRINADNTVTALNADDFRTDIGAGTGDGSVTNIAAGNGMDFTTISGAGSITLGTPGSLGRYVFNSLSGTTHTHQILQDRISRFAHIMFTYGHDEPGMFYGTNFIPDYSERVNYDGYLYATQLYTRANRVYSAGNNNIGTGPTNYVVGNHSGSDIHSDLGTVKSIATGNGITGGTITTTGTLGLTGQALALHNVGTNGIIAKTGEGTAEGRTITAGTAIIVTRGDGESGNPRISAKTYAVGDFAHGGIVFWVDATGQHGLVCTKTDQATNARWYAGTNLWTMAQGNGKKNTAIIIIKQGRGDGGNYATRICNELQITEDGKTYGDWYLPSSRETIWMHAHKDAINATALANGGSAFVTDPKFYWSSTEDENDNQRAYVLSFGSGNYYPYLKSDQGRVRAVRAF